MPNQVLAFHRVSPNVYDLTGLRTGSVRDQLLRSAMVARSLVDERQISDTSKLLILGAGAAGINAALTAAEENVSVDVIELNADPFATLKMASWRRIDPFEYDWPHQHYDAGTFPQAGGTPLVQTTDTGDALAKGWSDDLDWYLKNRSGVNGRGVVTILHSTNARPFAKGIAPNPTGGVTVTGPWPGAAHDTSRDYGAVLSCVGMGKEVTRDGNSPDRWSGYRGPAFWTDDDGIPDAVTPFTAGPVVISGGGDGGMQDFQRVLTGKFGKELLHDLTTVSASVGLNFLPPELVAKLLAAEDAGRRAYAWQREKQPIKQAMLDWHSTFETAVNAVFQRLTNLSTFPHALPQVIGKLFRSELYKVGHGSTSVTWVYRDATPGYAYALNRFLTLMLMQLASHDRRLAANKAISVHPCGEIVKIAPSGYLPHKCTSPQSCFGMPHDVTIKTPTGTLPPLRDIGLIIVRHGTNPDPLLAGAAVREQMTPFDFPM